MRDDFRKEQKTYWRIGLAGNAVIRIVENRHVVLAFN